MELKETLQFYRKRQGLSQIELAEALDVSRQTISKWETGMALPSAENLLALSQLYGVPVDALLNGVVTEAAPKEPELIPVSADLPSAPPSKLTGLPRWRLVLQILAALLVCDIIAFFMDVSLYGAGGEPGFLYFAQIFRIVSCCAIGLVFARRDRFSPVNRRRSLLIAAAALVLALYPMLFSAPILWRLYDFIAWYGLPTSEPVFLPPNPIRTFIAWTLCEDYAFFSHMCAILFFQLGRFWFSRKRKDRTPQPQATVHQI